MKNYRIGMLFSILGIILLVLGAICYSTKNLFDDTDVEVKDEENKKDENEKPKLEEETACIDDMKNKNLSKVIFETNNFTLKVPFISCVTEKFSNENETSYESSNGVYQLNISIVDVDAKNYYDELQSKYVAQIETQNYSINLEESIEQNSKSVYLISVLKEQDDNSDVIISHTYNIIMEIDNNNSALIRIDYGLGRLEAGFLDEVVDGIEFTEK